MSNLSVRPLVTVSPRFKPLGCDPNALMHFEAMGMQLQRDKIFLFNRLGLYPKPGVHCLLENPGWINDHLNRVTKDIRKHIPEAFDDILVIDYSEWSPVFEMSADERPESNHLDDWDDFDRDFRTDFKETFQKQCESKSLDKRFKGLESREVYGRISSEFFIKTINRIREERPKAKIAMAGHVFGPHSDSGEPQPEYAKHNRELSWLHEMVDIITPTITFGLSRKNQNEQIQLSEIQNIVRGKLKCATEIGEEQQKQVVPLLVPIYSNRDFSHYGKLIFSPVLKAAFEEMSKAHVSEFFFWYGISSEKSQRKISSYIKDIVMPLLVKE